MIVNKNVIFILCLLFCSKALSYGGLVRSLLESIQTGSQKVHKLFGSAKPSDEVIDGEFNRMLDEILEMKGVSRRDLSERELHELRSTVTDPLKLIYNEEYAMLQRYSSRFSVPPEIYMFETFHPYGIIITEEVRDLFRTFLQRRLDITDQRQMKRLRKSVNKIAREHNLPPYEVLYLLCRHNSFKDSDFIWFEDLYLVIMKGKSARKIADQKKKALQNMAHSCFFRIEYSDSGGWMPVRVTFNKDMFFTYWEGQAFRDYIIDFNFMNRYHLVDTHLLLSWANELKRKTGRFGQLPAFIRFSFEDVLVDYDDVWIAMSEHPFLKTVFRATKEDDDFAKEVERILRSIVLKRDEPSLWDRVHNPSGL